MLRSGSHFARKDQNAFQKFLRGWDLQVVDPPNSKILRPWVNGEFFESPTYNIWTREQSGGPWNIQIMLCDFEGGEWVYRRHPKIRGPIHEFSWTDSSGLKILSPVVQLLYKSKSPRDKDLLDLQNCLPHLDSSQKARLKELILADSGQDHPWLSLV